ncbi:TetR/AcrR family transcriptional regulator [Chryseobacterium gwangjuense]|uniref:TetR/AcrR family transcriptional regulator n=1 Tax=Chryseobacterium gwangjuense TaxID=1069980 RepID=UPI001E30ADE6|nr:TetR family transcriptional regulator [Chryseobacterium gwangjuense]MCE3075762.1 TetR family transcriptional regulator [Chryseobacterium gwangjuense]
MKESKKIDVSTEEKIKEAARTVFYKKGFAATRTRDIAEEADINLALLNYYFRSKAKLFEMIMMETLSGFIKNMVVVLNDEKTTLERKVEEIASRYIDLITKEPEIPTFIVTEIRNNPNVLLEKLPIKQVLANSVFFKQHKTAVDNGEISEPNPLHFLMNMMGLVIFPFIAKPLLMGGRGIDNSEFNALMAERKKLIPIWIKSMMKGK